jgi:hypothetical protein
MEDVYQRNFTMPSDSIVFAGINVSFGRKPITLAVLDEGSHISVLEKCDIPTAVVALQEYKNICLVIDLPSSKTEQSAYVNLKKHISEAGFSSASEEGDTKRWFETDAQECFREWIGQSPLSRRILEGRLQRSLILYEHGLRIKDPMDVFDEITRFKLIHGTFRIENVYAAKELDALMVAHLAWMSVNRPDQVVTKEGLLLPAPE